MFSSAMLVLLVPLCASAVAEVQKPGPDGYRYADFGYYANADRAGRIARNEGPLLYLFRRTALQAQSQFTPPRPYIREMKCDGVLPASFDRHRYQFGVHAIDRRYWASAP